MGRFRLYAVVLLLSVVLWTQPTFGQDQSQPVVGIITDPEVYALSYFGEESGIGQLAAIFRAMGADVQRLNLDEPIPDHISVIVMVRPRHELNIEQLARVWSSVENGANLLLAIDPRQYKGINGEAEGGALNRLFTLDYGLRFYDNFLAEPWFHLEALEDFQGSILQVHAEDVIVHPITQPLLQYGLPVYLWGGRSVDVAGLWPSALNYPLLYTESAFGELSSVTNDNTVFEVNLDEDFVGRLFAGGVSTNTDTGSRVVLLGDSEMLQDRYGLSLIDGTAQPVFAGNFVLAQRIAAWLLEVPEAEWLALPDAFTWITIDGMAADWDMSLPAVADSTSDAEAPGYELQQVHSFYNDQALYLLIENTEPPAPDTEIEIIFSLADGTTTTTRLSAETDPIIESSVEAAAPAANIPLAIADFIEIRVPLFLLGSSPDIEQLCIYPRGERELQDCSEAPIVPNSVVLRDPTPLDSYSGPLGIINTNGPITLRSKPVDTTSAVTVLQSGTLVGVLGQNKNGEWIKIWNAGYVGWIPDFQMLLNTNKQDLPVLE